MSVLSRIAGLSRTIEYGYPDAVRDLARDRELLRQFKSDPDARSSYRQSQKLIVTWHRELAELGELVFRHLPDVAARLRTISPATGTVDGKPGTVDALVQELRTIQAAALAADAGPVVTTPTATAPDQDLDDGAPPIPGNLRKWIKDLPPDDKPGLRPAHRREQVWLTWHTSEGLGPAAIRDRWNGLDVAVRKTIAPRCFGTFGSDKKAGLNRVKQALVRARRDDKANKPKPSRRTTSKRKNRKT